MIVHEGRHEKFGMRSAPLRSEHIEPVVGHGRVRGAPFSFQSGMSSLRAIGSMTAPDRIWAPTSEPFSSTQTEISRGKLFQADGGGKTGRTGADDDDIILHRFALNLIHR